MSLPSGVALLLSSEKNYAETKKCFFFLIRTVYSAFTKLKIDVHRILEQQHGTGEPVTSFSFFGKIIMWLSHLITDLRKNAIETLIRTTEEAKIFEVKTS